ncbi:hypothetical protein BTVI_88657 [Pitangus sulphuratus]|nr:hypothetical protein BTVI_88657 [Pitangus sulphuratus]
MLVAYGLDKQMVIVYPHDFADNIPLGRVVDIPEACAATQSDLSGLEKWDNRTFMEFSKGRCEVLHMEENNPRHQYMLKSSLTEKDLGVLVDTKLTTILQCELVAKKTNDTDFDYYEIVNYPKLFDKHFTETESSLRAGLKLSVIHHPELLLCESGTNTISGGLDVRSQQRRSQ